MGLIASGLILIGWLVGLVGGIMLLVAAFKVNIWWGLGCIFLPFVALVFLFMHWPVAKNPFFIELAGIVLVIIGIMLGGSTGLHHQ
ncbi:MAG TPA: hypothetical protein VN048_11690 [Verrucomicrobiae bacterium]|jgi:hypothetical protein|nr:hypothetical protein [Verrucomicrobiae bacterium]